MKDEGHDSDIEYDIRWVIRLAERAVEFLPKAWPLTNSSEVLTEL